MPFKCNPCCCVSSTSGAMAIGVLDIITATVCIFHVVTSDIAIQNIETLEDPELKKQFMQELRKGFKGKALENADDETIFSILHIWLVSLLLVSTLSLILGSLLIIGIRKERLRLIKVYLIAYGIVFAVSVVAALVSDTVFALVGSFAALLGVFVRSYCLIVVEAAYMEIRSRMLLPDEDPAAKYEQDPEGKYEQEQPQMCS